MNLIKKTVNLLSLAGLVFLLFLFVFESQLKIPAWLQVVGRMHPLLLHFPLVLVTISLLSYWIPANDASQENAWNLIRLFAAFTAIGSAIMGLLLSIEKADSGDILRYHQWGGLGTAIAAWLLYSFHSYIHKNLRLGKSISIVTALLLIATGHWGATITHGENYLTGPLVSEEKKIVDLQQAKIFPDIMLTVLKDKCGRCHIGINQKGGLSLADSIGITKGGKNGPAIVPGDIFKSLLITRIHLPLSDKKHMPESDKPQLSNVEIALLEAWIKAGAPFNKKLSSLPVTDSFRLLAVSYLSTQLNQTPEVVYNFPQANASTIDQLNNNYRVIKQQGKNSPALSVSFFGRQFYTPEKLKELEPLKTQIIQLNLAKMPVTDEQLNWISNLPNLEKLNINYSNITDEGLKQLTNMKSLSALSCIGTAITLKGLQNLLMNKNIQLVYVWDTKVNPAEIAALQKANPHTQIDLGFQGADTMKIALNQPTVVTPDGFFRDSQKIVLSHVIKGVALHYSLDGTEPDSSETSLYTKPFTISNTITLLVKAYKPGWLPSLPTRKFYLKAGIPGITTTLLTPPDVQYPLKSANQLTDLNLADPEDINTNWLGYRKNDAIMVFDMGKKVEVKEVLVNALYKIRPFIFPPIFIKVWGSDDQKNWTLLQTLRPEIPKTFIRTDSYLQRLAFEPVKLRFIKLQAHPIPKLPVWHPGKGQAGWFFLSEVVIN